MQVQVYRTGYALIDMGNQEAIGWRAELHIVLTYVLEGWRSLHLRFDVHDRWSGRIG